jgi:aspartate racemase
MPHIDPPGGPVSWPRNEGVLGVVGVAPWATIEFCRAFYALIDAEKDWHYPRVLLDVNTKLPSRGRHLQLGERDPSPYIAETIDELAAAGATVAVVVCNTAHILYERWSPNSPIPIINIMDAVIAQAQRQKARHVVALTSTSLAEHDLYGRRAEAAGLSCHRLTHSYQDFVGGIIEQVKQKGGLTDVGLVQLKQLLAQLKTQSIDTVQLGCTELSILKDPLQKEGYIVVDSNEALAQAAYDAITQACG